MCEESFILNAKKASKRYDINASPLEQSVWRVRGGGGEVYICTVV